MKHDFFENFTIHIQFLNILKFSRIFQPENHSDFPKKSSGPNKSTRKKNSPSLIFRSIYFQSNSKKIIQFSSVYNVSIRACES